MVAVGQVALGQGPGAAQAFGDVLAGHFQVNAARMHALGLGDLHKALHLAQDPVERPGLVAIVGGQGVAVHGVDGPDHLAAGAAGGFHQPGQAGGDLVRAEAAIEGQAARLVRRVQRIDQAQQFVRLQGRTNLEADGVLDPAHIVHMGAVQLAGALADPQQVGRGVVPVARGGIDAGHGLLEAQQQGLVAGEELHPVQFGMGLGGHADGGHEVEGFGDLVGQLTVSAAIGAAVDKAQGPAMDVVQVGIAAAGEGAQQVQGRGRLVIGPHQALGVGRALGRVERHAVDIVAAIGRQGHPALGLHRRGARLGELAGHAPDLHHRLAAGEGQHHRHLQDQAKGVADIVGGEFLEALGAVAALQQKGATGRDIAQQAFQAARLTGEHQRRQGAQGRLHPLDRARVRIVGRDVLGGLCSPGCGRPTLGHDFLARARLLAQMGSVGKEG